MAKLLYDYDKSPFHNYIKSWGKMLFSLNDIFGTLQESYLMFNISKNYNKKKSLAISMGGNFFYCPCRHLIVSGYNRPWTSAMPGVKPSRCLPCLIEPYLT